MSEGCVDVWYALFGVKQNFAQRFVPEHLPQNHPCVKRNVLVFVSRERCEQDLRFRDQVLYGWRPGTELPT